MHGLNKGVSSVHLKEQVFFSFDFTCALVVPMDGLIYWQTTFKSISVFPLGSCVVLKKKPIRDDGEVHSLPSPRDKMAG